jgi:thiamine monophosphate synthase
MRISKIIVALLVSVVAMTVMTGVAVAEDEIMLLLQDPAPPDNLLAGPIMLTNDGVASYDLDVKIYDYLSASNIGQIHTTIITVYAIGGSNPNHIQITATERGTPLNFVTGPGTVTLTRNYNHFE